VKTIPTPTNIDALSELGRTCTDNVLFIHYATGEVRIEDRRSTVGKWYQIDESSMGVIRRQYAKHGRWIRRYVEVPLPLVVEVAPEWERLDAAYDVPPGV